MKAALVVATLLAGAAGCGATRPGAPPAPVPPDAVPVGAGPAPRYRPPPFGARVKGARRVGSWSCTRGRRGARFAAHVELIVDRRVVLVPAGVGLAPPQRRRGAYVTGARCSYPVSTREPTGVIEIDAGTRVTLGELFALWGQPLARDRLASFRGQVHAWVGGRRWARDPRTIPLRRHAVVVLQLGRSVPPHTRYAFPPGL